MEKARRQAVGSFSAKANGFFAARTKYKHVPLSYMRERELREFLCKNGGGKGEIVNKGNQEGHTLDGVHGEGRGAHVHLGVKKKYFFLPVMY